MSENYPHIKAHYVVQTEMKGQSQALWLAKEYLHGPMMMVFSDTLAETDFSIIGKTDLDGIAWVKSVEDPRRFGVAEVDTNGYITRMVEKPTAMDNNRVVIGLYYYKEAEKIMDAIQTQLEVGRTFKGEYFLTEATNIYLERGAKMKTQEVDTWLDAGTPEAILETNQYMLQHGRDNQPRFSPEADVKIIPPVFIHPGAKITHSIIGPGAAIQKGCIIDQCEIQNTIMDVDCVLNASKLNNSLLGRKVVVENASGSLDVGDNSRVICGK